ncbi:MAG: hypothetical protein ACRC30_10940 [Clostridium sp.]
MRGARKNIKDLEERLKDVRKSYKEVLQSSEDVEVDEDGVIVTGSLGFDLGELDSSIDYLETGLTETLELLGDILDKFEGWMV